MALPHAVKIVEHCQVSPPSGSVPSTCLPLTFLDIPWLLCTPVKRLFFFEFPHPTHHFINTVLPNLKRSLSLTLQHFFPLAGHLEIHKLSTSIPQLIYRDGDAVPFTVVESTGDFNHLSGYHPRELKQFIPLVAELPPAGESSDSSTMVYPVMAFQFTIFPNSGICMSITNIHMIDGRTCSHFVKSWASLCRSGGDMSCLKNSIPFFDRSIINDPDEILLKEMDLTSLSLPDGQMDINLHNNVRATFSMGRKDIEKLKLWISTQCNKETVASSRQLQLSTFSVTIAFLWVCLTKARDRRRSSFMDAADADDDDDDQHLYVLGDCRNLLECPLPTTYFGNCLVYRDVNAKKSELIAEDGVVMAAKAITCKVNDLKNEPLKGFVKCISDFVSKGQKLSIAGSPRFRLYDTDFGWGKPKKSEAVHIVDSTVVCVGDYKDEEGGIEFSLALTKPEMHNFSFIFEQSFKIFSS